MNAALSKAMCRNRPSSNCQAAQPRRSLVAGQAGIPGVIGIVAGRLKEKAGKPAIVIALDADGTGKGSGRSISGVDLGAAIIAAREAGLLIAGGGHAMAAGLTVDSDKVEAFADWLDERLGRDVARASAQKRCWWTRAHPARPATRLYRRHGGRRTLRYRLARTSRGHGASAGRQMRYRRQRPCPRDRFGR